jgi:hypothetical protein
LRCLARKTGIAYDWQVTERRLPLPRQQSQLRYNASFAGCSPHNRLRGPARTGFVGFGKFVAASEGACGAAHPSGGGLGVNRLWTPPDDNRSRSLLWVCRDKSVTLASILAAALLKPAQAKRSSDGCGRFGKALFYELDES